MTQKKHAGRLRKEKLQVGWDHLKVASGTSTSSSGKHIDTRMVRKWTGISPTEKKESYGGMTGEKTAHNGTASANSTETGKKASVSFDIYDDYATGGYQADLTDQSNEVHSPTTPTNTSKGFSSFTSRVTAMYKSNKTEKLENTKQHPLILEVREKGEVGRLLTASSRTPPYVGQQSMFFSSGEYGGTNHNIGDRESGASSLIRSHSFRERTTSFEDSRYYQQENGEVEKKSHKAKRSKSFNDAFSKSCQVAQKQETKVLNAASMFSY